MRARVSDCTRSTAASAVRPVITASSQLVHPAAVVGEHAIGFEHIAMLAALDHVAVFEQLVEIGAQASRSPDSRCFSSFGTSSAMNW